MRKQNMTYGREVLGSELEDSKRGLHCRDRNFTPPLACAWKEDTEYMKVVRMEAAENQIEADDADEEPENVGKEDKAED
jgi:hypothetical protein